MKLFLCKTDDLNFYLKRPLIMNVFNQRVAQLGFLFLLSCLMVLTTVYSRDVQGANQANFQTLYTFSDSTHGIAPSNLIQTTEGNFYGTTYLGGENGVGTMFELYFNFVKGEWEFLPLYSLAIETDGANPMRGGLLQSPDGSLLLYGTTTNGGAYNQGTFFAYEPAKQQKPFKTEFSFNNPPPVHQSAGVVATSTGMFVGSTSGGGANLKGSLYGYIPGKLFGDTIYSFQGPDGNGPNGRLTSDRHFVYGVTVAGGKSNLGTIFKFDSSNKTLETLYSFTGGANDGAYPQDSFLLGKDGNLYGIVKNISNEATLFKLDLRNNNLTQLVSFGKSDGQPIVPFSLIQGSDGNFYGTTFGTASTIFKVAPTANPTERLTTLYTWDEDLGAPTVIQGRDNNLYGITGGYPLAINPVPGTIFKFNLSK
jgi:uncharacterized repeat protein (TIGR03803 family)